MWKSSSILALIILLFAPPAWAACTGSSPEWTTTPDYTSVAACVAGATAGDTINVSAGDGTEDWDTTLTITKGVNLIGPGSANLTITNTYECASHVGSMITYTPATPANNTPFRLSGFTLDGGNLCSILNLNNAASYTDANMQTKVRVDNNTFTGVYSVGSTRDQAIAVTGVYGVIDNNLFDTIDYPIRFSSGPSSPGTRWQNLTGVQFGAADNNMYLEKNTFTGVGANTGALVDCQAENRYVFRYNSITIAGQVNPLFDMHGNNGAAPDFIQSCFGGEIYGNQINAGDLAIKLIQQRGGHALVFFNNTDTTYSGTWPVYSQVKQEYGDSLTGHACADESGNYCTTDGEYQHVHDSYYWNNRKGLTTLDGNGTGAIDIQSTFSGTPPPAEGTPVAGVNHFGPATTPAASCGASRPGTCTVGASYWETSQENCSDLTGYVGTAATAIAGTLYKCTATNTWTSYYTPLTYPHPLRGEADTTDPEVAITTEDPSAITEDSLAVEGTASDAVGVSSCKFRIGSAPDADNGTACTGTTSWTCNASGFTIGANTLYVGCGDAAGNWGSDSITVNYNRVKPIITLNVGPVWTLQ